MLCNFRVHRHFFFDALVEVFDCLLHLRCTVDQYIRVDYTRARQTEFRRLIATTTWRYLVVRVDELTRSLHYQGGII
jgi:hypothetical protein